MYYIYILDVEFSYAHTTNSMGIGCMSGESKKPKVNHAIALYKKRKLLFNHILKRSKKTNINKRRLSLERQTMKQYYVLVGL